MTSDRLRNQGSALQRSALAHEPVLSASEIASYTFCRQAWHLGRRNVIQSVDGVERLSEGIKTHRNIGARADRLRAIEFVRQALIVFICGFAASVLIQLLTGGALRVPW